MQDKENNPKDPADIRTIVSKRGDQSAYDALKAAGVIRSPLDDCDILGIPKSEGKPSAD